MMLLLYLILLVLGIWLGYFFKVFFTGPDLSCRGVFFVLYLIRFLVRFILALFCVKNYYLLAMYPVGLTNIPLFCGRR